MCHHHVSRMSLYIITAASKIKYLSGTPVQQVNGAREHHQHCQNLRKRQVLWVCALRQKIGDTSCQTDDNIRRSSFCAELKLLVLGRSYMGNQVVLYIFGM